ncbi:phosphatase PAP2 family protein [Clostridium drakei]
MKMMSAIQDLDNYILLSIKNKMHGYVIDKAMVIITYLGNGGIIWIAISILLMSNEEYRNIGFMTSGTLILSTIIGEGIVKHLVRRIRPCNHLNENKLLISEPKSYSFPSGHTLSSFAVAGVLSVYFAEYSFIFIGIAFLIALSRVYLYVHYPTDVIAGIVLGLLCSKLVFMILQQGCFQKIIVVCN